MNLQKIKNNNIQTKKGFTLVEALVAVFVFSLVMISVVSIFSKFVVVQKRSRAVQQNMEDAKYAMELMSKTIRTSSVVSCNGAATCPATTNKIEIYDYSQGMCIVYSFSGGKIQSGSANPATAGDKNSCSFGSIALNPIVGNTINQMNFGVDQTVSGTKIGKVTISMTICSDSGCGGTVNDLVNIQTTVSLRDYQETN